MHLSAQVDRVVEALHRRDIDEGRCLIAIAGPPASGKSTLAEGVQARLNAQGHPCGLVPMDGFHLDNTTLKTRGLLARKGAPETFDAAGFVRLVARLRHAETVCVPLFDRAQDRVLADAARIQPHERFVVVEGNYLFLNSGDWRALADLWSYKVFVSPSLATLKERLVHRWITHGLAPQAAEKRATENDLVNARTVLEGCDTRQIDLVLD
ncbi:hypothetical protein ACS3SW_07405 [Roseobacteraceae bacterium S113]